MRLKVPLGSITIDSHAEGAGFESQISFGCVYPLGLHNDITGTDAVSLLQDICETNTVNSSSRLPMMFLLVSVFVLHFCAVFLGGFLFSMILFY